MFLDRENRKFGDNLLWLQPSAILAVLFLTWWRYQMIGLVNFRISEQVKTQNTNSISRDLSNTNVTFSWDKILVIFLFLVRRSEFSQIDKALLFILRTNFLRCILLVLERLDRYSKTIIWIFLIGFLLSDFVLLFWDVGTWELRPVLCKLFLCLLSFQYFALFFWWWPLSDLFSQRHLVNTIARLSEAERRFF